MRGINRARGKKDGRCMILFPTVIHCINGIKFKKFHFTFSNSAIRNDRPVLHLVYCYESEKGSNDPQVTQYIRCTCLEYDC